ncbi:hypothetical protein WJ70_24625 [Burkholderia ubonensis]|nr:hypothetical protein WJ70_24625 [Burkholderia ubonensis]
MDQRLIKLRFRIFVFEIEEFENVWILDRFLGRHCIAALRDATLIEYRALVPGHQRPSIELTADLSV